MSKLPTKRYMLADHAREMFKETWATVLAQTTCVDVSPLWDTFQKEEIEKRGDQINDDSLNVGVMDTIIAEAGLSPWPMSWFEYMGCIAWQNGMVANVGVSVVNNRIEQGTSAIGAVNLLIGNTLGLGVRDEDGYLVPKVNMADAEWIQAFHVFVSEGKRGKPTPAGGVVHFLDKNATHMKMSGAYIFSPGGLGGDGSEEWNKLCGAAMHLPLFAIKLLKCKNVSAANTATSKMPKGRRHKGAAHKSLVFKTLFVSLPGKKGVPGRRLQLGGDPKRMHLCRGHFADYTNGGGLFGKLHGMYWIPSHVRGNKDIGEVKKDYELLRRTP